LISGGVTVLLERFSIEYFSRGLSFSEIVLGRTEVVFSWFLPTHQPTLAEITIVRTKHTRAAVLLTIHCNTYV